MKTLFLAGHSDSGDSHLPQGVLPWPERTRDWLAAATGEEWQLVTVRFAPLGRRAPDYLLSRVEAAAPDIVILPLTAYVCTVGTVEGSVRARFGERAARWVRAREETFHRRTNGGSRRRRLNRAGRTVARRVLGVRPFATVAQTAAIYEEVLHRLARIESHQVVAVADARFSPETQSREPKLHQRFEELYATVIPVAEAHHFLLADLEGRLRAHPDRRVFYQDDGVHTTTAFHDVYARLMEETLGGLLARQPV